MSADHKQKPGSSFEVKLVASSSNLPSQKKAGTIVIKMTAEDVKRFIVQGDSGSKEFKMKLPLKLKLSNDPTDPQAKIKARLVMADQPTSINPNEDSHPSGKLQAI
jgi:hypothetical protein